MARTAARMDLATPADPEAQATRAPAAIGALGRRQKEERAPLVAAPGAVAHRVLLGVALAAFGAPRQSNQ
eukprot:9246071-Pyramimonas_sp.AAC.1